MQKLRTLLRIFKWTALGLLGLVVLYGALAVVLPRIAVNPDHRPPERGIEIFLVSNGVHVDFVVPARSAVRDWTQELPPSWFERVDPFHDHLSFGWGDKGFYLETPTWSDLRFSVAFKAAFFLSSAALHVTWCWRPRTGERCRSLRLTDEQYRSLCDWLLASFQRDESGALRRIDHAGYGPHDRFFEANGTYSLVRTCNEWTGAGLREIGVKTGVWTPFAGDVLRHLDG